VLIVKKLIVKRMFFCIMLVYSPIERVRILNPYNFLLKG
jgi:hypothetical protein